VFGFSMLEMPCTVGHKIDHRDVCVSFTKLKKKALENDVLFLCFLFLLGMQKDHRGA
jgi:hypothetical protein